MMELNVKAYFPFLEAVLLLYYVWNSTKISGDVKRKLEDGKNYGSVEEGSGRSSKNTGTIRNAVGTVSSKQVSSLALFTCALFWIVRWTAGYQYDFFTHYMSPANVYRIEECFWQAFLTSSFLLLCFLTCCARPGFKGRLALSMHWLIYVFLLPFAVTDRFPIYFGCPSPFYYVFSAYSVCLQVIAFSSGKSLSFITTTDANRLLSVHVSNTGSASSPRESMVLTRVSTRYLAAWCAFLSLTYLFCTWIWKRVGHEPEIVDIIYHLAWSFIRPSYFLLGLLYLFNHSNVVDHMRCLTSGNVGKVYYGVFATMCVWHMGIMGFFCPLAREKEMSICVNDSSSDTLPRKESLRAFISDESDVVGNWFHVAENLVFMFSYYLFVYSECVCAAAMSTVTAGGRNAGTALSRTASKQLGNVNAIKVGVYTMVCVLLLNSLSRIIDLKMDPDRHYEGFLLTRYVPGYVFIIMCALILQ